MLGVSGRKLEKGWGGGGGREGKRGRVFSATLSLRHQSTPVKLGLQVCQTNVELLVVQSAGGRAGVAGTDVIEVVGTDVG